MSDADWKRAQNEPLQGESELHFKGKQRLSSILRRAGFYSTVEFRHAVRVAGFDEVLEVRSDVVGISPERFICCECDGPAGHKTTRAFDRDNLKTRRIKESTPHAEVYPFHYKRLIGRKAWTDKEIAEEIGIASTLDKPCKQWL